MPPKVGEFKPSEPDLLQGYKLGKQGAQLVKRVATEAKSQGFSRRQRSQIVRDTLARQIIDQDLVDLDPLHRVDLTPYGTPRSGLSNLPKRRSRQAQSSSSRPTQSPSRSRTPIRTVELREPVILEPRSKTAPRKPRSPSSSSSSHRSQTAIVPPPPKPIRPASSIDRQGEQDRIIRFFNRVRHKEIRRLSRLLDIATTKEQIDEVESIITKLEVPYSLDYIETLCPRFAVAPGEELREFYNIIKGRTPDCASPSPIKEEQ